MKIQLNYDTKTITLAEKVELYKLIEWCEKHIDDIEDWTLNTNTTVNWTNPIVIKDYTYPRVNQPWWEYIPNTSPYYTTDFNTVSGTYNIEINA